MKSLGVEERARPSFFSRNTGKETLSKVEGQPSSQRRSRPWRCLYMFKKYVFASFQGGSKGAGTEYWSCVMRVKKTMAAMRRNFIYNE